MAQVDEKNAMDCISLAEKMLLAIVHGSQERIDQYPFTPNIIRNLVNILVN
jgi:hypothetical protein